MHNAHRALAQLAQQEVAGDRLRLAFREAPARVTEGPVSLDAGPAHSAGVRSKRPAREPAGGRFRWRKWVWRLLPCLGRLGRSFFHGEAHDGMPRLDLIAVLQVGGLDANAVNERAVAAAEV